MSEQKRALTFAFRLTEEEQVMLDIVSAARGLTGSALLRTLLHDAHRDYQERRLQVARGALR